MRGSYRLMFCKMPLCSHGVRPTYEHESLGHVLQKPFENSKCMRCPFRDEGPGWARAWNFGEDTRPVVVGWSGARECTSGITLTIPCRLLVLVTFGFGVCARGEHMHGGPATLNLNNSQKTKSRLWGMWAHVVQGIHKRFGEVELSKGRKGPM